jgi:flagellar hook-associated protein 3 FlgL
MTRITQRMLSDAMLSGLNQSRSRTGRLQEQLATGKVLNRPSDSPTGLVTAMQTRGALARKQTNLRSAQNGMTWLTTADSALQGASSVLRRVRDLTVQGANASVGPTGRENIALEIEALRDGLLEIANTTLLGRQLFAGTSDTAQAFDATGTYQGDGRAVQRTVGDGQKITVNVVGSDAFGDGPTSVFAALDQLVADLRTDPAAVGGHLAVLDDASDRILTALGDVGARMNRIEGVMDRGVDQETTLRTRLSEAESTDLTDTIMELRLQEVAYESALAATAKVLQPSLLDFLR